MEPPSLDYWRGFFSGARATIFDAIDAAIRVAAADQPEGLRARRDAIAERLYTALLPAEALGRPATRTEQPLQHLLLTEDGGSVPSLCSSDRAEGITDDGGDRRCDGDDSVVTEAFRVKAALSAAQEKSEAELLELLGRLRQLEFTVDAIMATEIGMAVKPLRKHSSKRIRQLVRSLIEGWKAMVKEWMSNGGSMVKVWMSNGGSIEEDHTPQSVDASCLDEEEGGLPSPPMDEAALFATPCTSIRLSEFFDDMDDDGNIRSDAKEHVQCYRGNQEPAKDQPAMGQSYDPEQNWRLDQSTVKQSQENEPFSWQTGKQSNTGTQGKPSSAAFGPGRPQMPQLEQRCSEARPKQQQDISMTQSKPKLLNQPSIRHDENSVRAKLELAKDAKLEATKRKLQEDYQEFNNAKKQRTVQMVDPQDLPMQGNRNFQLNGKSRNNSTSNTQSRFGMRR